MPHGHFGKCCAGMFANAARANLANAARACWQILNGRVASPLTQRRLRHNCPAEGLADSYYATIERFNAQSFERLWRLPFVQKRLWHNCPAAGPADSYGSTIESSNAQSFKHLWQHLLLQGHRGKTHRSPETWHASPEA